MVEQHIIEYQPEGSSIAIDVSYRDDDFWFTQAQIAQALGIERSVATKHIGNVYEDEELDRERTCANFAQLRKEGKRYVSRPIEHYNIDVVISVGFRVRNSKAAIQLRQWSQQALSQLVSTGYVINESRLASGDTAYYDEIAALLKAIRRSETLLFEKARDILATSTDYDSKSPEAKYFFASVQNKLHYAVTGYTAPELIHSRADHQKPHMGLVTWQGNEVSKGDVKVAKNYLMQEEMMQLENLVDQFLLHGEFQLLRRRPMKMQDWINAVDELIEFNRCEVLQGKGKRSRAQADKRAHLEYEKYVELMGGTESLKAYERQVLAEIEEETRQYLKSQNDAEV